MFQPDFNGDPVSFPVIVVCPLLSLINLTWLIISSIVHPWGWVICVNEACWEITSNDSHSIKVASRQVDPFCMCILTLSALNLYMTSSTLGTTTWRRESSRGPLSCTNQWCLSRSTTGTFTSFSPLLRPGFLTSIC